MSQFSGKQYRGAKRVLRELKREEAEARQKESNKRKAVAERQNLEDELEGTEPSVIVNANPGPAVPGLVKRARKVTKH